MNSCTTLTQIAASDSVDWRLVRHFCGLTLHLIISSENFRLSFTLELRLFLCYAALYRTYACSIFRRARSIPCSPTTAISMLKYIDVSPRPMLRGFFPHLPLECVCARACVYVSARRTGARNSFNRVFTYRDRRKIRWRVPVGLPRLAADLPPDFGARTRRVRCQCSH
jgi:hypothetical protein